MQFLLRGEVGILLKDAKDYSTSSPPQTPPNNALGQDEGRLEYLNRQWHNDTFQDYRGADKSLARTGKKQARTLVRDARDFNNIETRAVTTYFPLQGKAKKENGAILTETLTCFLPGRDKDLLAPLYRRWSG